MKFSQALRRGEFWLPSTQLHKLAGSPDSKQMVSGLQIKVSDKNQHNGHEKYRIQGCGEL
jgi:hypothetical protein